MNVVGLEPGTPWADEIRNAVGGSRALVLVIGPGWSAALEKAGLDGQDFVELEVQIALERPDVSVIPVLVGGAAMPQSPSCPGASSSWPAARPWSCTTTPCAGITASTP